MEEHLNPNGFTSHDMIVHQKCPKTTRYWENKKLGKEKKKKKVITWHSIWLESDPHRDLGIVSWNVKNVVKMMIESEALEPWNQRENAVKVSPFFFPLFFFFSFKNHIKIHQQPSNWILEFSSFDIQLRIKMKISNKSINIYCFLYYPLMNVHIFVLDYFIIRKNLNS